MIDCSTLSSRCYVSANEQAICSLLWELKYIALPLLIIIIGLFIYKKYKSRGKKHNE